MRKRDEETKTIVEKGLHAGMRYFPDEKLGFFFSKRTHRIDEWMISGQPFQLACKLHARIVDAKSDECSCR
jgi:hypothetical protein